VNDLLMRSWHSIVELRSRLEPIELIACTEEFEVENQAMTCRTTGSETERSSIVRLKKEHISIFSLALFLLTVSAPVILLLLLSEAHGHGLFLTVRSPQFFHQSILDLALCIIEEKSSGSFIALITLSNCDSRWRAIQIVSVQRRFLEVNIYVPSLQILMNNDQPNIDNSRIWSSLANN
jgi:hypothetical protein